MTNMHTIHFVTSGRMEEGHCATVPHRVVSSPLPLLATMATAATGVMASRLSWTPLPPLPSSPTSLPLCILIKFQSPINHSLYIRVLSIFRPVPFTTPHQYHSLPFISTYDEFSISLSSRTIIIIIILLSSTTHTTRTQ